MATRQDYRERTRAELKIDPSGRVWNDTVINRAVQQALYQVQQDGSYDWPFNDQSYSGATVISTGTYALPTGFVRVEEGTVQWNGGNLDPVDYRALIRNNSTLAVDGTPGSYYLRGSYIGLFPRPNNTYNLTFAYRGKLADFSDDTTDNGIPNEFTEAVIQYACYLLWTDIEGRSDKGIEALQNYKQVMEGLNTQYLGRRDESNFSFGIETVSGNYSGLTYYT
jgi:hypothetical protein